MIPQTLTPAELDELAALEAKATPGEWTSYRLVHADTRVPMTPDELGEYVKNSFLKSAAESDSTDFLAVLCEKPDGPADVCHVGNGPTSPANARLIAALRNHAPALLSMARRLGEAQATLDAIAHMVDAVHDQSTGPSYPGTDDEVLSGVASLKQRLQEQTARAEAAEARLAEVTAGAINTQTVEQARQVEAWTARAQAAEKRCGEIAEETEVMFVEALVALRQKCAEVAHHKCGDISVGHEVGGIDVLPFYKQGIDALPAKPGGVKGAPLLTLSAVSLRCLENTDDPPNPDPR